jgi:hypothetical protein
MAATAKSRAAAQGMAATAKMSPSAATPAPLASTAASASMAATAVLRISHRRNGRDRHRDQQRTDRLQEISGRHLGSRFDHSSSPHFMRAHLEGREAIH